jgi:hypothetical protein
MAILASELLSLEVRFVNFAHGSLTYEIGFLWNKESMINDALLKRSNDYHRSRSKGYFLTKDYIGDQDPNKNSLVDMIEKVLETGKPEYWETLEIGEMIAIYPEMFFPFMESHWKLVHEPEWSKQQQEEREKKKRELGKLPDDEFTVIAFIDAYQFEECDCYYGEGIALHMRVQRVALEDFCAQLKGEYLEFKEKYKIDEYKREDEE